MTSPLLSRMMFAFRAGLQYGGRRNLYEVFGYPRSLTSPLLYGKYQRQDIVSRIVDMPPEEMWSEMPTFKTEGDIKTKWEAFAKKGQLASRIVQADKMCAFGPFSIILLGLPGKLEMPAPKLTDVKNLQYAEVYGGDSVRITRYVSETSDPNYGKPSFYQVRTGVNAIGTLNFGESSGIGSPNTWSDVHASRVIHIVDRPVQGQLYAEPRLGKIYNLLEDLAKISGGSAELYWILGNRGMQVDVDKEMELDAADETALTDELDEFQHGLRRYIRTRGVKINPLGSETADPRGPFEVTMHLLSAATNIPQRILMGAEAGQLASEQDRANWAEYIGRRRAIFAVPFVLQPIFRKLGEFGYIDKDAWLSADNDSWLWPEAFHMNPVEESNSQASWARSLVNVSRRNQFGNPVASDEECRVKMGLPPKPPATDTMPAAPPPKTPGGIQGVPGGASDAPNAVKQSPSDGTGSPTEQT